MYRDVCEVMNNRVNRTKEVAQRPGADLRSYKQEQVSEVNGR